MKAFIGIMVLIIFSDFGLKVARLNGWKPTDVSEVSLVTTAMLWLVLGIWGVMLLSR